MSEPHPTIPEDCITTNREFDIPYEHYIEFDYTTFPDADTFAALRDRHKLTSTDTVVYNPDEGFPKKYFHWYNDDILLTTDCNPLTGEFMRISGEIEYRERGYASRITIRGKTDSAISLYTDIIEAVEHIKGGEVHESSITPDGERIQLEERFPDRLQQFYDNEMEALSKNLDNQ